MEAASEPASSVPGAAGDASRAVMSDRVQTLAGTIYQELERMIAQYDEGVVKALMPLVVNVLECLDLAYTENQEHEVELELLREDNEQLATQYEREKQLRRISEQRALELEDNADEQQKSAVSKMESLESIVRMFELKQKNTADHVSRLEEKEETMKKEYCRLHERYNELLRSHMDYMERTKMALGTDRLDQLALLRSNSKLPNLASQSATNRSSGPVSFGFQSLEALSSSQLLLPSAMLPAGQADEHEHSPINTSNDAAVSLSHSIRDEMQIAVSVLEREHGRLRSKKSTEASSKVQSQLSDSCQKQARLWGREMSMDDVTPDHEDAPLVIHPDGIREATRPADVSKSTTTTSEHRSDNNLYQELSFQEHESSQEPEDHIETAGSDTFFGVGKEIDNLIRENNELLATKNALNIVKDDLISQVDELTGENDILREEVKSMQAVRSRLQLRIQELEDEMKRVREELEKVKREAADEDEVPMAQRKRFTRVEMARVLMERNQYKERYMELQDALKWTEMIRASRNDAAVQRKAKQGGVWGFFSNLFSSSDSSRAMTAGDLPCGDVQYDAPSGVVTPMVEADSVLSTVFSPGAVDGVSDNRRRVLDFSDANIRSEKVQQRLASEKKEQYKKVQAHVTRDDGRIQAYGWSLPAKMAESEYRSKTGVCSRISSASVPVPVPVYCRPLIENEPGMKVWCAAGVNLTGGYTRDGGSVVGSSVFYLSEHAMRSDGGRLSDGAPPSGQISDDSAVPQVEDDVELLSQHLQQQQKLKCGSTVPERNLSSLVWICTSTHTASKVTVVDANNPADVLDSFSVCSSHLLCIASVPGASVSDYSVGGEMRKLSVSDSPSRPTVCSDAAASSAATVSDDDSAIGAIRSLACAASDVTLSDSLTRSSSNTLSSSIDDETDFHPVLRRYLISNQTGETCQDSRDSCGADLRLLDSSSAAEIVKDGIAPNDIQGCSSVMPTMWLGAQSGYVYIHSARAVWRHCICSVKLQDSVLCIMHLAGRVFVSLANGTLAVFYRDNDGRWDLSDYHLLDLKQPQFGIRCMVVVQRKLWCGCRNRIHVIEPTTLAVESSFIAHPRRESQVRQMAWIGDGVWISIRLDSTLRLYHAHTHQHLQDVDIEPYVSKMLACCGMSGSGKLGYSFVRISSLVISCNRMWIGTGNGVIISVPLNVQEVPGLSEGCSDGDCDPNVAVYSEGSGNQLTPASFVPYCNISQAQLSFHGYRDSVKFFVGVPGVGGVLTGDNARAANPEDTTSEMNSSLLVMSGGEGYVDFRVDEDPYETASHIIVWQLAAGDRSLTDGSTRADTAAASAQSDLEAIPGRSHHVPGPLSKSQ